jgi:hypothetical protein
MRICARRSCFIFYAASIRDCTRLCTSTCFPIIFIISTKPEPFIFCKVEPADNSIQYVLQKESSYICQPLTIGRQSDENRRSVYTECPRQEPHSFLCTSLFETIPLSMMQPDTVHVSFFSSLVFGDCPPPKPDDHETIIFALPSCNDE